MASNKSRALSQAQKAQRQRVEADKRARNKEYNSALAILKKKGLYNGKATRGEVGWRARALVNSLQDVIAGKSAVVSIPKQSRKAVNVPTTKEAKGGLRR